MNIKVSGMFPLPGDFRSHFRLPAASIKSRLNRSRRLRHQDASIAVAKVAILKKISNIQHNFIWNGPTLVQWVNHTEYSPMFVFIGIHWLSLSPYYYQTGKPKLSAGNQTGKPKLCWKSWSAGCCSPFCRANSCATSWYTCGKGRWPMMGKNVGNPWEELEIARKTLVFWWEK